MTGTVVRELRDATQRLDAMIAPEGPSSVLECLWMGPSINKGMFVRALSDLEKGTSEVVSRIRTMADKEIGEEEELEQLVASSKIVNSATDLLQRTRAGRTRTEVRIREYPSGLSFWQKAVISVKQFFGYFTKTRYVEISTVPLDVQKVSAEIHAAMVKEFAKTLPKDFEKEHKMAVALAEKKVEGPQAPTVFEVTDQGELHGMVEGKEIQAPSWKELGEKIERVRGGVEEAKDRRASLIKELDEKVTSALPSELPEASWYIQKKGDAYVFCQKGQPPKEAKIADETTAKSINELFGVDVSDASFVLNIVWAGEKGKLDQKISEDEVVYAKKGRILSSWVAPSEASTAYLFVSPGEQAGEKGKALLQIGVGEQKVTVPIEADEVKRTFTVKIDDKEYSAPTFDDLQKQILGADVHGKPLRHIDNVIGMAEKNLVDAKKAVEDLQGHIGNQFLESTQEDVEREIVSSLTLKGLAKEGVIACRPWKGPQDQYFLTMLNGDKVTTLPLDISTDPGKVILRREVDKGGDAVLWPKEGANAVKDTLKGLFWAKDVKMPGEYMEIREQVGSLRDEILQLAEPAMDTSAFSDLVHGLGENAKKAFLLKDVQDSSMTLRWWDGKTEKDVVVDLVQNPGALTVIGRPPYPSVEVLLQGEIGVSKKGLLSYQALESMATQLQEYIQKSVRENPLYIEKDRSKEIVDMIHKVGVPQAWWIGERGEKSEGLLAQAAGVLKWTKNLVTGEKAPLLEGVEKGYCIKVCMSDGAPEEIPLHMAFVDGRWRVSKEGGKETFDTIDELIRAEASEFGVDTEYSHMKVYERLQRYLAVEKEIKSSGVGTGKTVLKGLAGLFTSVFLYKYYQGEVSDPEELLKGLAKDASLLKRSVGCVFKKKDEDSYQLVLCNKDGKCTSIGLEIDSKSIPGKFGIKGGKKFESFAAFRDEVLNDVLSLADAEAMVKRATLESEKEAKAPSEVRQSSEPLQMSPQPETTSVVYKEEGVREETPGVLPKPPISQRTVFPLQHPSIDEVSLPARPGWFDKSEYWVTVGKKGRLDKHIGKLIENVNDVPSLVTCDAAGGLNTDERAFHAWVKALGGASEKLSDAELDKMEESTKKLPLLERFWLLETAIDPKVISKERQKRAIYVLEHCLKANIKPDEQQRLLAYLAANADSYGNEKTQEDAIAFLLEKVKK